MDKDIDIEVGDLFVITRKGRHRNRPCPYADKVFVVKSFTNTGLGVYYDDNRTNIRCKCINCSKVYIRRYDEEGGWSKVEVPRSIGVNDIKVVEKRLARERDIKIKLLGI
jgi:hypothetical protein